MIFETTEINHSGNLELLIWNLEGAGVTPQHPLHVPTSMA